MREKSGSESNVTVKEPVGGPLLQTFPLKTPLMPLKLRDLLQEAKKTAVRLVPTENPKPIVVFPSRLDEETHRLVLLEENPKSKLWLVSATKNDEAKSDTVIEPDLGMF